MNRLLHSTSTIYVTIFFDLVYLMCFSGEMNPSAPLALPLSFSKQKEKFIQYFPEIVVRMLSSLYLEKDDEIN